MIALCQKIVPQRTKVSLNSPFNNDLPLRVDALRIRGGVPRRGKPDGTGFLYARAPERSALRLGEEGGGAARPRPPSTPHLLQVITQKAYSRYFTCR
jgi:hypothetical protein